MEQHLNHYMKIGNKTAILDILFNTPRIILATNEAYFRPSLLTSLRRPTFTCFRVQIRLSYSIIFNLIDFLFAKKRFPISETSQRAGGKGDRNCVEIVELV